MRHYATPSGLVLPYKARVDRRKHICMVVIYLEEFDPSRRKNALHKARCHEQVRRATLDHRQATLHCELNMPELDAKVTQPVIQTVLNRIAVPLVARKRGAHNRGNPPQRSLRGAKRAPKSGRPPRPMRIPAQLGRR